MSQAQIPDQDTPENDPETDAIPGADLAPDAASQVPDKPQAAESKPAQVQNPLHGVTLEAMLTQLVARLGWPAMGKQIQIRCFTHDPSIGSSLKFLRKTPWARAKVEVLYLKTFHPRKRRK
ncbi:MAG: hypothetical protein CVV27_13735 [Candidatus Melainabacteria bacterium HGW-Melainabacteria-1]|nr:MAG: hypothetical protein CVV27_13735 [Candidatus Melainabacteria bacterium HGW-Melainabacteria-1]